MLTWSGPEDASHVVLFAPGDSGCTTDRGPSLIAAGLAAQGLRVAQWDFACDSDDAEERDAVMAADVRAACGYAPDAHVVLGGMSRGARVSAGLVEELGAVALLAFAYPFHSRLDPRPHGRERELAAVSVPVLLCQGTRDAHGNQQQITGYRLPPHIHVHWLVDANHPLRPRPSSGFTQEEQLAEATRWAAGLLLGRGGELGPEVG